MRLVLSIEYKGTHYYGWQIQNHHKKKTIQYHVEEAISKAIDAGRKYMDCLPQKSQA